MSTIQALKCLSGSISPIAYLSGKMSVLKEYDIYAGDLKVTPKAFGSSVLQTTNKLLTENIVVTEVPYFETSNGSSGTTVYIAKEV